MAEDDETPVDWVGVRAAYEAGEGTLDEICARFGTTRGKLGHRKLMEAWAPRVLRGGADRAFIIRQLFRLLERQIRQLEKDMTQTGEKEVAVLGKLASTLEKLIDIEKAAEERPKRGKSQNMHELRDKLAERIEQLKRA